MSAKIIKFSEIETGDMFHARNEGGLYRKLTNGKNIFFNAENVRTGYKTNFDQNDLVTIETGEINE